MKNAYFLTQTDLPNPIDPTRPINPITVIAYLTEDPTALNSLNPLNPTYLLNRIETTRNVPKHQGWGTKLLTQICDDADKEHATLILGVSPDEEEWYAPLIAWYTRFGFVPFDKAHPMNLYRNVMIRDPQPRLNRKDDNS